MDSGLDGEERSPDWSRHKDRPRGERCSVSSRHVLWREGQLTAAKPQSHNFSRPHQEAGPGRPVPRGRRPLTSPLTPVPSVWRHPEPQRRPQDADSRGLPLQGEESFLAVAGGRSPRCWQRGTAQARPDPKHLGPRGQDRGHAGRTGVTRGGQTGPALPLLPREPSNYTPFSSVFHLHAHLRGTRVPLTGAVTGASSPGYRGGKGSTRLGADPTWACALVAREPGRGF